jgi:predicted anti-sigma-YlaC factor YlaD
MASIPLTSDDHAPPLSKRSSPPPPPSIALSPPARNNCRQLGAFVLGALLLVTSGCSVKKYAINQLGNALSGSGTTFASDDDPELVKAALPFSLKLIESLLAESPRHEGLLLAACSGFTQYGYAFVKQASDELEDKDLAESDAQRHRTRRLFLRSRSYGLRALEVRYPQFEKSLRSAPKAAVRSTHARDIGLLFWTAASWGAAISVSKDDPALISDQLIVEALIDRALELDEDYDRGAIHGLLIGYEMVRQGAPGDPAVRARRHFERAVALSHGKAASPYVSLAESVAVPQQNRGEFEKLLQQAIAIDPDNTPEMRLANLIAQRRARWLLGRTDELFLAAPVENPK